MTKEIRKDKRNYNKKLIEETIKDYCKMKVLRSKLSERKKITKICDGKNVLMQSKDDITKAIEIFYTNYTHLNDIDHKKEGTS